MPLSENLAHNPGMCPEGESNWLPFGSQSGAQSTEPRQPGLKIFLVEIYHTRNGIQRARQSLQVYISFIYICIYTHTCTYIYTHTYTHTHIFHSLLAKAGLRRNCGGGIFIFSMFLLFKVSSSSILYPILTTKIATGYSEIFIKDLAKPKSFKIPLQRQCFKPQEPSIAVQLKFFSPLSIVYQELFPLIRNGKIKI